MSVCSKQVISSHLDRRFQQEGGLYGRFEDLPLALQLGHYRRKELLQNLDIGDLSDKVCLDFGTGAWGFAAVYPRLHHCRFAYGMDLSPAALELARQVSRQGNFPYQDRVEYLESDGMDLPLPDASVDLIFAGEAIEHVRLPSRFLRECHRVLREGGQLILTTPNRDALLFRMQGERYCVGPEHFWLFNCPELQSCVAEYFDIRETLGFNGSVYRDLDHVLNEEAGREWASLFRDNPENATGLVLHATRRPGPTQREYALHTVPQDRIRIEGPSQTLPLALDTFGTMIEQDARITVDIPPCNALVLHFWSHSWSGHVSVVVEGEEQQRDLYSRDGGWMHVHLAFESLRARTAQIRSTGARNPRSHAAEVIFFEATYVVV